MCTLSWIERDAGYELWFNRDEQRSRLPATVPELAEQAGVRYVLPRDGDHGGSWIMANEMGVTLCLLNHYPAPPADLRRWRSRGAIVVDLADVPSAGSVGRRLRDVALGGFRPFTLVAIDRSLDTVAHRWDGESLTRHALTESDRPLVSSSFDTECVHAARRSTFDRLYDGTPGSLERYHRSHAPGRGPYSVCMHRDDALTQSVSRVRVAPDRVTFGYHAATPCSPASPVVLELQAAGERNGVRSPGASC